MGHVACGIRISSCSDLSDNVPFTSFVLVPIKTTIRSRLGLLSDFRRTDLYGKRKLAFILVCYRNSTDFPFSLEQRYRGRHGGLWIGRDVPLHGDDGVNGIYHGLEYIGRGRQGVGDTSDCGEVVDLTFLCPANAGRRNNDTNLPLLSFFFHVIR